jgi:hypothetical protein
MSYTFGSLSLTVSIFPHSKLASNFSPWREAEGLFVRPYLILSFCGSKAIKINIDFSYGQIIFCWPIKKFMEA